MVMAGRGLADRWVTQGLSLSPRPNSPICATTLRGRKRYPPGRDASWAGRPRGSTAAVISRRRSVPRLMAVRPTLSRPGSRRDAEIPSAGSGPPPPSGVGGTPARVLDEAGCPTRPRATGVCGPGHRMGSQRRQRAGHRTRRSSSRRVTSKMGIAVDADGRGRGLLSGLGRSPAAVLHALGAEAVAVHP
jgi:hypothetical protein